MASEAEVLEALPEETVASGQVRVDIQDVARDWADGWKDHFRPIVIGGVRVRPPWEAPADPEGGLVDVVINPGLGFGTGLHPTTRGTLELLQAPGLEGGIDDVSIGPLVDVGTGSGILAITAAKLGWGPVFAFDNDPMALASARENVVANGVAGVVEIHQTDVEGASAYWFSGATVLANMTLDPVLALIKRLSRQRVDWSDLAPTQAPERLIVSGILVGVQEQQLRAMARLGAFTIGRTRYEGEWVSLELMPTKPLDPAGLAWG
jgi:ribosomal protein L11 methyltransferase